MKDAQFVKIARALADPTRHQMLREIREGGELNCSQICERFNLKQPTISHHLKMLSEAGVVQCRREGQYHVMNVDESVLSEFARAISGPKRPVRGARRRAATKRAG